MQSIESQPQTQKQEHMEEEQESVSDIARRTEKLAENYLEVAEKLTAKDMTIEEEETQQGIHSALIKNLRQLGDRLPEGAEMKVKIQDELLGSHNNERLKVMQWAAKGEYKEDLNSCINNVPKSSGS